MEKIRSNIWYIVGGIIFALSSSMLSVQLIVAEHYEALNIAITIIISFLCAIYFWIRTVKSTRKIIKGNIIFSIICGLLALVVLAQLYLGKGIEIKEQFQNWIWNPFKIRSFVISSASILYIGIYVGNKIKKWVIDFYQSLDLWDKKAYLISSAISCMIIIIAYCLNHNYFLHYDKVYSLDSGFCFEQLFPKATYYDIRHPILNMITFPIWAIVNTIVKLIFPGNLAMVATAILLQLINAQLLIVIGLQIKQLTKNKMIFVFYMLSFSTILYSIFFEKYQLCTFFIVLYVFSICRKKKGSIPALVASAGAMPTSCFIGIAELLRTGKIKEKIKRVLKIMAITICTLIVLGRGHLLTSGITELTTTKEFYSQTTYNLPEKLVATTKMVQSSLFALPSSTEVREDKYWWENLESKISIVAIGMILVIIIGIVVKQKELFVKIAAIWSAFSTILFVILNWSTYETPLFTLYFSWALIPLFIMGMDFIIGKLKLKPKIIYGIILVTMTVINAITIFDIQNYLMKL